jgi:hypothetical protein
LEKYMRGDVGGVSNEMRGNAWSRPLLTRIVILGVTGALAGLFVAGPMTLASKTRPGAPASYSAADRQIDVAGAGTQRDPACSITTSLAGFAPGIAMIEVSLLGPSSEHLIGAEEVAFTEQTYSGYQASVIFGLSENLHLVDPAGTHFPLRVDVRRHSDGRIISTESVLLECYTGPNEPAAVSDL